MNILMIALGEHLERYADMDLVNLPLRQASLWLLL